MKWIPRSRPPARALVGHTKPVQDARFSSDGHWLATASEDSTVRLWNITASGPVVAGFVLQHKPGIQIHTVAFSPDGRWLATGAQSGVRLWNLLDPSAEPKTIYEDSNVDIIKVAFSPDANWLIAGATETYQALLFHTPFDGPQRFFHVNQWVGNVAFSPDKRWLVVPDHYKALVLDLNKADPASEPVTLRGHKDAITDMAFSPDGMWFAMGSADHSVQLWNVRLEDLISLACRIAGRNLCSPRLGFVPAGFRVKADQA
jgi:WD40 repeat protein